MRDLLQHIYRGLGAEFQATIDSFSHVPSDIGRTAAPQRRCDEVYWRSWAELVGQNNGVIIAQKQPWMVSDLFACNSRG
jgi:hypothetical protein